VQKRDAEGGLKAPSPIAVHDTSEGAIPALTAVATAATEAENDLERVKAGHLDANAACLQVAVKVGRAVQALRLLSHNEARWFSSGPDPAMHEQIKEQIDRLYAPCMHLARVAEATAAYSKTPNVGEPTLLALVTEMAELGLSVGWKAPTTLAEADVRAQPPEPACAPGSAEQGVPSCNLHDDTREQKRNDVRGMLATKLVVVFDACNDEKETIEKAIARDEKIKDIVTDLVVGSFVGLTFGAAGAAAGAATEASALEGAGAKAAQTAVTAGGHTEARMLAQATQQLAKPSAVGEVVKAGAHEVAEGAGGLTREVAKEQVKGVVENVLKAGIGSLESADTRERTLRMIEGLKNSATRATDAAFSKIVLLNDDDLQSVYFNLKNADFSGAVHELIGRYREQVEPIGDGYSSGGNMVVGQAARIVAPDGRRRLALVEMTEDASIVGMGTRAVVAGTSMAFGIATPEGEKVRPTADQAKQFILDPTVSISFVRWIDDDMAPAAEATGAIDIPLARIFGNQDEAASGF
jgi:hypothetical protein